ncbi:undecaprenyl-phosphate glucose phosphotransferase [Stenotrophomonas sp. SY1]|uniref:undecaprenyl-phosphate glucose phosphotransferase n=1 Tax=Stenotrophomonas sp. SY1 TaxID=477235 RepID=UPI001E605053|nr:undecaprenyl-phosphate glucose phosphotransferase [Stenotrophomonas sp. SY1]MCD9086643.1 undecaprenyl-phosphate glucose phosphotransferase [Stenotrophomonas sp. SY1]
MLQDAMGNVPVRRKDTRVRIERRVALDLWLRIADSVAVPLVAVAVHLFLNGVQLPSPLVRMAFGALLLSVVVCFTVVPVYRCWWLRGAIADLGCLLLAWTAAFGAFAMFLLLAHMRDSLAGAWLLGWYVMGLLVMLAVRLLVRIQLHRLRSRGLYCERVLLIGLRAPALKLHRLLGGRPEIGKRVVGYFAAGEDIVVREGAAPIRLGTLLDLSSYLQEHQGEFDQVWVSLPLGEGVAIKDVLKDIEGFPVPVRVIPDTSGLGMLNPGVYLTGNVPMIGIRQGLAQPDYRLIKRALDLLVASIALLGLAPVLVMLALGVKLSSPGPVLFRQRRHGLGGREFWMLKFRSMRVHQEALGTLTQASLHDPRITRFGAFMRRTSLDELPQFLNVLVGNMSVVGPRPHAVQHNNHFQRLIQRYMHRHYVKPGITGWAQVHGLRGETPDLRSMRKRVQYDIDYIRRWSPILDLRIIALTAVKVLGQRMAY